MARGNKAHRDAFISIQAETKEMLRHIIPAVQHMPKYDRIEGLGAELKNAAKGVLVEYHIARHCPAKREEHISPEKSIRMKPEGVGAAIGRLIWQTAMGLYINDDITWLVDECGIKAVCFVDDIVMAVPEHLHGYALALIPELRKRFARKGVRLNEKKFYDQPATHGLEFLGSHIMPYRVHPNRDTVERAIRKVEQFNEAKRKYLYIDQIVASINSYTGLTKNRTGWKDTQAIKDTISPEWWAFLEWDTRRQCVVCKPGFTWRDRMNGKYHLKLRKDDKRRTRCAA